MPLNDSGTDTPIFTDNDLNKFWLALSRDYDETMKPNLGYKPSAQAVLNTLYMKTIKSLYTENGAWSKLSPHDKLVIEKTYHLFCSSIPSFVELGDEEKRKHYYHFSITMPQINIYITQNYLGNDDMLFNWLAYHSLFCHHHNLVMNGCFGFSLGDIDEKTAALIALIILSVILLMVTAVAIRYLLIALLDAGERVFYNEGILRAIISLGSMIAGAVVGALFGYYVAATPIMWLSMSASFGNPLTLAIIGIVLLSIIGAASISYLANVANDYYIEYANKNALHSAEPEHCNIDAEALQKKGLDPLAIKLAIIHAIKKIQDCSAQDGIKEAKFPTLFARWRANHGREIQYYINLIRQMRQGELIGLKIDDRYYNFMDLSLLTQEQVANLQGRGINSEWFQQDKEALHQAVNKALFSNQLTNPAASKRYLGILAKYQYQANSIYDSSYDNQFVRTEVANADYIHVNRADAPYYANAWTNSAVVYNAPTNYIHHYYAPEQYNDWQLQVQETYRPPSPF